MDYINFPDNVAILGAAGKMGSGITLLLAMEMTNIRLETGRDLILNAVDISENGLEDLKKYVAKQSLKRAGKDPDKIRNIYGLEASSISDYELSTKYSENVINTIKTTTEISSIKDVKLVFEAVNEDLELKTKLISIIKENSSETPVVFTNTSSIPIRELEELTGLQGNVLGFHFYNPPAVQKLVELITSKNTKVELVEFAKTLAQKINKNIVPSSDVAGFIGNGHFMRDLLFGINKLEELSETHSFSEAAAIVDYVTRDLLIRPMGILQLADYVGLDVCQKILLVMNKRIENENLHSSLLDSLVSNGIKGGQYSDGSQKNGFFKYQDGQIVGVFNNSSDNYVDLPEINSFINFSAENITPWKEVIKSPNKYDIINNFFNNLKSIHSEGAHLAFEFLYNSRRIAENLVQDNVTASNDNVNKVLLLGFYHAYGPINDYI